MAEPDKITKPEDLIAQLQAELDRERAMFQAVIGGEPPPTDEAIVRLGCRLADYVSSQLRVFHQGETLTKMDALTLQTMRELADNYETLVKIGWEHIYPTGKVEYNQFSLYSSNGGFNPPSPPLPPAPRPPSYDLKPYDGKSSGKCKCEYCSAPAVFEGYCSACHAEGC